MNRSEHYDVLIVGAGMVGATLACALAGSSLRVAVLEGIAPRDVRAADPVDLRVSAITRASRNIFTALDAWEGMLARRVSPYREMHVWDAGGDGVIHFDSADVGEAELGHIVENRVVQIALWDRLQRADNVSLYCPAACAELRREAGHISVRLEDGRLLSARLVVGADGAQSRVRRFARIPVHGWQYDQHGVVATVRTERSHRETAWQRFLPDGPLAFLPLHDGRCSIVWSTSPGHAATLLAMEDAVFCEELTRAFAATLGRIAATSERAAFPLHLQHAERYVTVGLALIGDAAHTVHPLAGQGVNLGILDAAALAEVLLDARAAGKDHASLAVLRRYERWRKGHNLLMMASMDGFKRLFGSDWWPLRAARNAGLTLTDRLSPVKHLIMAQAMGRGGDLPRLARAATL